MKDVKSIVAEAIAKSDVAFTNKLSPSEVQDMAEEVSVEINKHPQVYIENSVRIAALVMTGVFLADNNQDGMLPMFADMSHVASIALCEEVANFVEKLHPERELDYDKIGFLINGYLRDKASTEYARMMKERS